MPLLAALQAAWPLKVEVLILQKCNGMHVFPGEPRSIRSLTTIDLSNCTGLYDISALFSCSKLKRLDMAQCCALANLTPLSGCAALETLTLQGCTSISQVSAIGTLNELRVLDLRGCLAIEDLAVLGRAWESEAGRLEKKKESWLEDMRVRLETLTLAEVRLRANCGGWTGDSAAEHHAKQQLGEDCDEGQKAAPLGRGIHLDEAANHLSVHMGDVGFTKGPQPPPGCCCSPTPPASEPFIDEFVEPHKRPTQATDEPPAPPKLAAEQSTVFNLQFTVLPAEELVGDEEQKAALIGRILSGEEAKGKDARFLKLEKCDVSLTKIEDASMFRHCQKLVSLTMRHCKSLQVKTVEDLRRTVPKLTVLID